ncbi:MULTISPECIES: hypothetical protein [Pseudomonas]|uniref:Uncharacterized protein n=1 Tax=Pseudomonas putida TaxID=303 RepID=A0A1B2F162_PSEPU|nr:MULTISPECIES: hypothetical protein [Pseudomonas]ANY85938.1 hypothetical protein IEC33019_0334 [Pseudomonas putida]MCL8308128.1 hypothetical protein [Pseudomonas putida]
MFEWGKRTSAVGGKAKVPKYSYNSKTEHTLCQWAQLAAERKKLLVYRVNLDKFEGSPLSRRKAEDVLNECDVFPTNLIDIKRASPRWQDCQMSSKESVETKFGEVALMLEVPPPNILGVIRRGFSCPVTYFSKGDESPGMEWIEFLKEFRVLVPPDKIFRNHKYYNEVLVVGRPSLDINALETRRVQVVGILCTRAYVSEGLKDRGATRMAILNRLRKLNPSLSVTVV